MYCQLSTYDYKSMMSHSDWCSVTQRKSNASSSTDCALHYNILREKTAYSGWSFKRVMPYFTVRLISLSPVFIRVNLNLSTLLATFKIQVFISGLSRLPLQKEKKREKTSYLRSLNTTWMQILWYWLVSVLVLVELEKVADLFDLLSLSIVYKWGKNEETS